MDSRFERLLREKIEIMMDMRVQNLTVTGANDFSEYKQNLGYIQALRDVLDGCDEIIDELGNP